MAGVNDEFWPLLRMTHPRGQDRLATGHRLSAEATTVQVCYDYAAKRTLPMPAELRSALETFEGRSLERK